MRSMAFLLRLCGSGAEVSDPRHGGETCEARGQTCGGIERGRAKRTIEEGDVACGVQGAVRRGGTPNPQPPRSGVARHGACLVVRVAVAVDDARAIDGAILERVALQREGARVGKEACKRAVS